MLDVFPNGVKGASIADLRVVLDTALKQKNLYHLIFVLNSKQSRELRKQASGSEHIIQDVVVDNEVVLSGDEITSHPLTAFTEWTEYYPIHFQKDNHRSYQEKFLRYKSDTVTVYTSGMEEHLVALDFDSFSDTPDEFEYNAKSFAGCLLSA